MVSALWYFFREHLWEKLLSHWSAHMFPIIVSPHMFPKIRNNWESLTTLHLKGFSAVCHHMDYKIFIIGKDFFPLITMVWNLFPLCSYKTTIIWIFFILITLVWFIFIVSQYIFLKRMLIKESFTTWIAFKRFLSSMFPF